MSVVLLYAPHQTGIPTLLLRIKWAKATELVLNHNNRIKWAKATELVLNHNNKFAPRCLQSSHMVASKFKSRLHLVSLSTDGRYECDDICPNFLQHFICAHRIAAAAAEDTGQLKKLIDR